MIQAWKAKLYAKKCETPKITGVRKQLKNPNIKYVIKFKSRHTRRGIADCRLEPKFSLPHILLRFSIHKVVESWRLELVILVNYQVRILHFLNWCDLFSAPCDLIFVKEKIFSLLCFVCVLKGRKEWENLGVERWFTLWLWVQRSNYLKKVRSLGDFWNVAEGALCITAINDHYSRRRQIYVLIG